eukprot:3327339-Prymnesium_polylepis.1
MLPTHRLPASRAHPRVNPHKHRAPTPHPLAASDPARPPPVPSRAASQEFHHRGRYYKGKGKQFQKWMRDNYPSVFVMHLERADGGRQDLEYDAAVPMYIMRPYIVEFLHAKVFTAGHKNVLEDFLYTTHRTTEYIAMMRANAIIDLLVARPMRFLAG